jgi:hypothetical protein
MSDIRSDHHFIIHYFPDNSTRYYLAKTIMSSKKLLIAIFLIFISIASFSQEKTVTIDLKGRGYLKSYVDLGDAGVVFHEAWSKIVNKHPGALYYYSTTGDLIWKKEITNIPNKTFVAASPDGSVVYYIELRGSIALVQIKPDGTSVEKELPSSKEITKNLTTVFCDKTYLYFLSTLNGDQLIDRKRGSEKLIVHRFKHSDFSYKQFTLALPPIASDNNTSFWAFLGQKDDTKYVLTKVVDPKAGSIKFTVVSFNSEGVIGKQFSISQTVPADQELVQPYNYTTVSNGAVIMQNMDNQLTGSVTVPGLSNDMTGGSSKPVYSSTNGQYSSAYFDPVQEQFWLVALTKAKSTNKYFDLTFFISQYNASGSEVWKSTIKNHQGQQFVMETLSSSLSLTSYSGSDAVCYELSKTDGKLVATQRIGYGDNNIQNMNWMLIRILDKGKLLRSAQYISTNIPEAERKSSVFHNFLSSKGELLVVTPKKGETKLFYFTNK